MGRYRGIETIQLREKLIVKGFGQGKGSSYQPWIRIGDFPNHGESFSVWCDKTQRQHHYFSYPEYRHHLLAEYLEPVIDIQEQYPLHPINETIYISNKCGIKHPQVGGEPCSITIDSLLTVDDGHKIFQLARSLKYSTDLADKRVCEKLELERKVCLHRNIPWELLTEKELTRTLEKNLRWLRRWKNAEIPQPTDETCLNFIHVLFCENLNQKLGCILDRIARKLGITRRLTIHYFQYTAWNKMIKVDLFAPIQLTKSHLALLSNTRNKVDAA